MRKTLLLAVVSYFFVSLGCTRKVETQSLRIVFNPHGSGQGAQTITGYLDFAVINIQLPTGPIVKQFEFHDNPLPAGQKLTVDIPNVPRGSFLVQFLGVFENDGQPTIFAYDDEMANVDASTSEVTLSAAPIGTFTREARVAGRYIDTVSPAETGPTGNLIMQFRPPGNKPKMSIEKFGIIDGWFNIMALDGAAMDYVLEDGLTPVFEQVKLVGSTLEVNGVAESPSNHLARFSIPSSYREQGGGDVEGQGPTEIWAGYIIKAGLTAAAKKVCVANDLSEGTRYFSDSGLTTRIDIDLTAATAGAIHRVAGGSTFAANQLYTGIATGCFSLASANRIPIWHTLLGTEGDSAAGLKPPFRAVKPFVQWDNYIDASYSATPSPRINLSWAYLPGVASIDGVAVLAKYSSNGGGSNHNDDCDDLLTEGYSEYGTVGVGTTTYAFTAGGAVTNVNKTNWRIALCPYKTGASGRKFVGEYVSGGQIGDWSGTYHTGWAHSTWSYTGGASETYTAINGTGNRVDDVDATSSSFYTLVTAANSVGGGLVPGDEVMLTIVGRGNSTNCGEYNGSSNDVGSVGFARVLDASGPSLKLQKGTWVDSLDTVTGATFTAAAAPGGTYCHVALQRLPHFSDLDYSSTTSLSLGQGTFDFATTAGIIIAVRVNGTLALGSTVIDADGTGYQGATSPGAGKGGGVRGPAGTTSTGTGGEDGADGGGGGGYGQGAYTDASGGQAYQTNGSSSRLVFGGGGGLGSPSNTGGNGGGAVLIAARNIHLTGNASIEANGVNGLPSYGGGGGGGSVIVNAAKITRAASETLTLMAKGGDGGGASDGGRGGGGSVSAYVCQSSLVSGTDILGMVSAGTSGLTGSGGGMVQNGQTSISVGMSGSGNYCSVN